MRTPPPPKRPEISREGLLASNPVGLVPIHWTIPLPELDWLLAEFGRLGFEGLQLTDLFLDEPSLSPGLLDRHQMRAAEVYASLSCSPSGPEDDALEVGRSRLELLRAFDGEMLVVALDGSDDRDAIAGRADAPGDAALTESGWRRLADLLEALSTEAITAGHDISFHPHAGTYVETPAETNRLLEETVGIGMGLCLDTGHCIVGGGDPVAVVDDHGGRLTHLHLKDVDPGTLSRLRTGEVAGLGEAVEHRLFSPLGSGTLDLAGVLRALDRVDYEGWLMVEQDSSWEPPAEASAISRRVLAWAQRHLGEHR